MSTMSIYLHMLLVVLHAPEVCLLPRPENLKVTSLNMGAILRWDAPRNNPSGLTYTAEIRGLEDFEPACRSVAELWCDLGVLPSCHGVYYLRVRAELRDQISTWSQSTVFTPAEETDIGPPSVTLARRAEGLELTIKDPTMKINSTLRDCLSDVSYDVKFWKKDHPEDAVVNSRISKHKVTLTHLDGDTSYCVQARVNSYQLTAEYSDPQCAAETSVKKFSATAVGSLVVLAVILPLVLVTAWLIHRGTHFFNPRVSLPPHFKKHLLEGSSASAMLAQQAGSSAQERWDRISCLYEVRPHSDTTTRKDEELTLSNETGNGLGKEMVQYCNVTTAGVAYRNIMAFEHL